MTASGARLQARPFSPRMVAIWQAGGAVALLAKENGVSEGRAT